MFSPTGFSLSAQGLGELSQGDFEALWNATRFQHMRKATMTAGYGGPAGAGGTGDPYVPQSIETTLASAAYKKDDAIAWNLFAKKNVFATVNEYNRIERHGEEEIDPFFTEGGTPPAAVTQVTRAFSKIVYLGVKGSVTFPMMKSKVIGGAPSAEAQEVSEKTLHLLGQIERQLYWSDSRLNPLGFDGLRSTLEQFAPNNIVDLRGQALTGRQMRQNMADHRDLNAMVNVILMSNATRNDLGNTQEGSIRRAVQPNQGAAGTKLGVRAEALVADHGEIPFKGTVFLKAGGAPNVGAIQPDPDIAAPGLPAITSAVGNTADTTALFTADDVGGTFTYKIVAVGPGGCSAPRTSAAITLSAGSRIVITMNDAAVGAGTVWYYRVYRANLNDTAGTSAKYAFSVARAAFGVATVINDRNFDLPNTTWAFGIQNTPDVVEIIRLMDLMKQDLAIRSTTKEFLLILFAAFRSRTPTKLWAWKNIGRLS